MENNNYKSFISLMEEIDHEKREQRDRGTLFELLVLAYFEKEPTYARLFDAVWKLSDVPSEYNIPKKDTGVDLVAREKDTGDLVAIQCKFYNKEKKIYKDDIDSFLNEVGKSYYAKGIVITSTDEWSNNAEEALDDRDKDIQRIGLSHFYESRIDWSSYSFSDPKEVGLQDKKTPRPHQIPAIEAVVKGFETTDRGKLIMAPGTGKTYTSMVIAEKMAEEKKDVFRVLYLVPSIQLLSQTLRGWNADTNFQMDSIAVCSDRKVTKTQGNSEMEDIAAADIGFPATTNYQRLLEYQHKIENNSSAGDFLAVFSTYQSIDVIIEAQKNGFYEFDLVVCDEAHRTTGATEQGKEDSRFTKVHYDHNIKAAHRLYQTATPRVYGEAALKKAEEMSVIVADMDNPTLYGEEFYRIGFGDAIRRGILTDYKVMVLAVNEEMIARRFQQMLANKDSELEFDDITKIIGCWNGLVRRESYSDKALGAPMKRAIAFTGTIRESKLITDMFSHVVAEYLHQDPDDEHQYDVEIDHADGSMNALEKNKKISWLKGEVPDNTCRILSNARFLTEGVDVPDLDAIMFLKPRKSKIDVAQAVGRVMRKVDGKEYGYVILPVGVPAGKDANNVLDSNEKYRIVWEVLNALRSLDERFDATINKLELNKKKPDQIQIIGVGDAPEDGELTPVNHQLEMMLTEEDLTDLERAIYGKIVRKVGDVRYWEDWAKDVAEIAQQHILRINVMLEDKNGKVYMEFMKFVKSIRHNINDSITETQAIEMLAQHLITKPVFEALFESYSFVNENPVSRSMENTLEILDKQGLMKEQESLKGFYESVKIRAEGIDNLKAKQDIIVQLYNKFFKVGFKSTTEQYGIVFTPVEVVDFIIRSVDDVLKKHFGKSLSSKGVNILDPFTGTGTFITRLLQSGLISKEELLRKYTQEIHANEIILLSYYIAAINIEETFHSLYGGNYVSFDGIVLTDTFEIIDTKDTFIDEMFDENNERIKKQKDSPIFAIIGNPPYKARQNSENDNNKKNIYPKIDERIKETYVKYSNVTNKNTLYDPLVRALRWSTDRIEDKGVIGFVINGSFIDSPTASGIRKSFYEDFNHLYIFNLRGNARTQGEERRREAGNVFKEGSRTSVAIVILVKDGSEDHEIHYHDIGDYLNHEQKLQVISELSSINSIEWQAIQPDHNYDWLNQKSKNSQIYKSLDGEVFIQKSLGVSTNRDAWVYGFSKDIVKKNAEYMIDNYNSEIERLFKITDKEERISNLYSNKNFISWSSGLKQLFAKGEKIELNPKELNIHTYRPFVKKWLYYDKSIIERARKWKDIFGEENKVILVPNNGSKRNFACLMVNTIPDLNLFYGGTQGFTLYDKKNVDSLFNHKSTSNIQESAASMLSISNEDVFYYTYAIMHSKDFRNRFENDLKKEFPRIPNVIKNKEKFVEIGLKLAELHLNYEDTEGCKEVEIEYLSDKPSFKVSKMKFIKKDDKSTIIFNDDIKIHNIPEKAYEYDLNGRSAIDWIMEQYQVKVDPPSNLVDNPNLYSDDEKYIFNLLLSIINVSIQTVDLVNSLPPLELDE
ncbi:type ISP restriction/modification enzyme [Sporosarcina sp. P17b]|uniref:DEAD/DEAH box helicase n=1 Tax=Sporosarcina sp. P17b TaxID=2048260 RepID=UPI000C163DF9|nr:type ISP restriction/modification enzyme [Sporosarcina sp. P17b]PIC73329.1 helicase [Sporosarcina sp. P17b]